MGNLLNSPQILCKVLINLLKNICNSSSNLLKSPQFSAHEKSGNPERDLVEVLHFLWLKKLCLACILFLLDHNIYLSLILSVQLWSCLMSCMIVTQHHNLLKKYTKINIYLRNIHEMHKISGLMHLITTQKLSPIKKHKITNHKLKIPLDIPYLQIHYSFIKHYNFITLVQTLPTEANNTHSSELVKYFN